MLDNIQKIISWYALQKRDFCDIGALTYARVQLATLLSEMAGQVAQLYHQKTATEFQRKSAHAEAVRAAMGVEKTSAAAAKVIADSEVKDAFEREAEADAEYHRAKLLYDSYRNICDVMNQHISSMKSERRAEYAGQGSQVV